MSFLGKLSEKQRIFLIIGLGIIAILTVTYSTNSSQNTAVVNGNPHQPPASSVANVGNIQTITTNNTEAVNRDPFKIPPQFVPPSPQNETSNQPVNTGGRTAGRLVPQVLYKLNGIASTGDQRVAAISAGDGKVKVYQVNDYIGAWQVISIDDASVTMAGPDGQTKVLTMGQALQKGGDKSGK